MPDEPKTPKTRNRSKLSPEAKAASVANQLKGAAVRKVAEPTVNFTLRVSPRLKAAYTAASEATRLGALTAARKGMEEVLGGSGGQGQAQEINIETQENKEL